MAAERGSTWEGQDRDGQDRDAPEPDGQAGDHQDGGPHGTRREKAQVRRAFWPSLKRVAANLPFAEDLLAAYYCAFDRATPLHVKGTLVGAIAYFVLPFDVIPDFLPVLGFTDDAAVLATAIRLVASHMLPEHREAAKAKHAAKPATKKAKAAPKAPKAEAAPAAS